jgi:hypothetical protein
VVDARVECSTVDPIAITDKVHDIGVQPDRLDDLLRGPSSVWMHGHVDMQNPSAFERQSKEHIQAFEVVRLRVGLTFCRPRQRRAYPIVRQSRPRHHG